MNLRIAILAACAGTLTLTSAGVALAVNNPIPGIDIIVRKEPGGSAIKVGDCQSGGGKIVKKGTKWVCTGMPVTGPAKARTKTETPAAGPARAPINTGDRKTGNRSSVGFAPLKPAEF